MEIELAEEEDSYQIPDFIHVIKEVTEDESFKMRNLQDSLLRKLIWMERLTVLTHALSLWINSVKTKNQGLIMQKMNMKE